MQARGSKCRIPTEVIYASGAGSLVVAEAPPSKEKPEEKRTILAMTAYSGGAMDLGGYSATYVDLKGMTVPANIPILRQHDGAKVVGLVTKTDKPDEGPLKFEVHPYKTEYAEEVVRLAQDPDHPMPWQASIGFKIHADKEEDLTFLDDEKSQAEVNGRTVKGPAMIAWRSTVKEASVVPLGADPETTVTASAEFNPKKKGAKLMAAKRAEDEEKEEAEDEEKEEAEDEEKEEAEDEDEDEEEKKKASLATLKAAFPKDREFALDQFEKGASLLRAKAAYADKIMAQADQKPRTPRTAVPLGGSTNRSESPSPTVAIGDLLELRASYNLRSDTGPAAIAYWQAVSAFEKRGQSRLDAQASVAKTLPELHEEFVSEVNGLTGDRKWSRCPTKTPGGIVRR